MQDLSNSPDLKDPEEKFNEAEPLSADLLIPEEEEEEEIRGIGAVAADVSRREGWERKLLDLSLRNSMLNLRLGRNILPVKESDLLKALELFRAGELDEYVGKPLGNPAQQLKELYRNYLLRLEETGANTFYLALGALRWFDIGSTRPHIAPIIFIPATISRKAGSAYGITLRDEEPVINVTLVEMLRQKFSVTLPDLDPLPSTEDGFPDWKSVFEMFRERITEVNRHMPPGCKWKLLDDSYVGIFSFTKYLLWNDIHTNPDIITQHPIIAGLIEKQFDHPPLSISAADIEMADITSLMTPLDYDSSQLEALAASHEGHSFVLHGPPGTGKSQTITNMIADAIYQGKRVLFVSEKKAALDVVRERLNRLGLEKYCLELHSNKTDKQSFFSQLSDSAINSLAKKHVEVSYPISKTVEVLSNNRQRLADVSDALHSSNEDTGILFDSINRYISLGREGLPLNYEDATRLDKDAVKALYAELEGLDIIADIINMHPAQSPLLNLYPKENSLENQQKIASLLPQLPDVISRARKKADSVFNRYIFHKTPEQLVRSSQVWKDLEEVASLDLTDNATIDIIESTVTRWIKGLPGLSKWYHFTESRKRIKELQLQGVLEYYLDNHSGAKTARLVEAGWFESHIRHTLDYSPTLRGFSGVILDKSREIYRSMSQEYQQFCGLELVRALENRINSRTLNKDEREQLGLLTKRIFSNGRGVSLRKTISESQAIFNMTFPCMLMSPLSVAQYLDMRPGMFDLVIFDEASQMETPEAIGAIARGNQLIVVGDPKQLPPTRFFTARTPISGEIRESEDAESILEDCIALGLPSVYLSRHYRSRHESLIAFSNSNFYDNRLLTFPSHNDAERKVIAIDPEGIYDIGHTRTNLIEAKAVVDYVINRLRELKRTQPISIGIVAFSKQQSDLIEDLLYEALDAEPKLLNRVENAKESLFIKNLENVQGDERDLIIFSIGYGPDANGKVSLNFGPINKIGGERRLNVAVSRARDEMVIFSSLHPGHIPTEGLTSKGVAALRSFLLFANGGSLPTSSIDKDAQPDPIVEEIADALRQKGLDVTTRVGRSSFKIDIAVAYARNPEKYRLGIILDGRDYRKLPTVHDREITVPDLLVHLGWNLKRVWTIDWFENPEEVIRSISKALYIIKKKGKL